MLRLGLVVALLGLWGQAADALEWTRPMGLYPVPSGPALAMLESRIEVTVRGPIVETVVVQRFRNTGDLPTEATYIFPLPADAAVSAMAMQIGTRTVHAAIEGRDAAQRRYEAAVTAGVAAALLDQERPDVFTQTVSAIPAKGTVEVTVRYDTLARYEAGLWQLALPMVVAPRYVPGTASGRATTGSGRSPDTDRAPDASRVTPAASPGAGGSTAVAIHFVDEPGELTSPTHELGGTRRDATFSDPHSDHDAIVRWRAPAASAGWVEHDGDGGFAAVVVEAPAPPPRKAAVRVILAIDRAATTRGDGDVVERPLVRALLGALGRGDRVRVIGGGAIGWSAPDDARAAIERAWAAPVGVFDLTRVLEAARPEGAAIVLVSDGLIADDPAAIAAARRLGVPVHVIGIGPAPARATLSQIAAASGGTLRYAVAGDDIPALARAALADVASLPAPIAVNWGTLAATDVEPAVLPRLGAGQAMVVLARIRHAQAANARVRGELFAFEALAPARGVDGATTARGPLARRWARERLGDLLAGKHDRGAVTSHALAYGLVSPYTSLVAVGNDVVVQGGVKRSVAVPVALPSGMQWHAVKQAIDPTGEDPRPAGRAVGVPTPRDSASPIDPTGEDPRPAGRAIGVPTPRDSASPIDRDTGVDTGGDAAERRGQGDVASVPRPPVADGKAPPASPPAAASPAAAPPPPPPPAPAKHRLPSTGKADKARGSDRRDRAGADDADARPTDRMAKKAKKPASPVAPRKAGPSPADAPSPAEAPPDQAPRAADQTLDESREEDDEAEPARARRKMAVVEASGDALSEQELVTVGDGRSWRLTAALGGGLAFDHATRGLAALDVRLETQRRTRLGAEAALWLVGGTDPEGRALVTVARAGLARWFELGFGAGVQFGNGTGIAGALRLRVDTPAPWLASFLRYDTAVLLTRPSVEAEHAVTLGLELSY